MPESTDSNVIVVEEFAEKLFYAQQDPRGLAEYMLAHFQVKTTS